MGLFKPNINKLARRRDIEGLIRALNHDDVYEAAEKALVNIIKESTSAADKDTIRRIFKEVNNLIMNPKDGIHPHTSYFEVRDETIKGLGKMKDKESVEELIELARSKTIFESHFLAIKALGDIKDPRAIGALIELLRGNYYFHARNDKDDELDQTHVVKALLKFKQAAVEPLIEALGDADDDLSTAAAVILGKIKDRRAIEPLLSHALRDDRSEVCNKEAQIEALEALGKEEDELMHELMAAGILIPKYWDKNWFGCFKISWGQLTDSFLQERDISKQSEIISFSLRGRPSLTSLLESLIRHSDGHFLIENLKPDDFKVCQQIVKSEKRLVQPLILLLNLGGLHVNVGDVALILGEIGDRRAVEPLLECAEEKTYGYKEIDYIIDALVKLDDERAISWLQKFANDPYAACKIKEMVDEGYGDEVTYQENMMFQLRAKAEDAIKRIQV
jgi:HEAT repeat protein